MTVEENTVALNGSLRLLLKYAQDGQLQFINVYKEMLQKIERNKTMFEHTGTT